MSEIKFMRLVSDLHEKNDGYITILLEESITDRKNVALTLEMLQLDKYALEIVNVDDYREELVKANFTEFPIFLHFDAKAERSVYAVLEA